jgi:TatA/E family protein of Tat protein translocase
MMGIGFPELMIILVIIMIIFGAGKLPEIGSAFGNSIKNFKKSMKEAEEIQEAANIEPTDIEADDNSSESLKEETTEESAEESAEDKTVPQETEKTTN